MAIAHVCIRCGLDLARARPAREAHYGLRLITCPRCRRHAVRREHPVWTAWRRTRRLAIALGLLLVQVVLMVAMAMLTLTASNVALHGLTDLPHEPEARAQALAAIGSAILAAALLTGVWLAAAFTHLNRRWVWLAWLVVMCPVCLAAIVVRPLDVDADDAGRLMAYPLIAAEYTAVFVVPLLMVLLIIMLLAAAFAPLGGRVVNMLHRGRAAAWRSALKRRRRARIAA